ncbi:hypothetical protein I7I48_10718 [Histoplasma ohiense]|nr:hypothetical protein I7I48_10718 [Histoplasma ohiense (nom. inval.)]
MLLWYVQSDSNGNREEDPRLISAHETKVAPPRYLTVIYLYSTDICFVDQSLERLAGSGSCASSTSLSPCTD